MSLICIGATSEDEEGNVIDYVDDFIKEGLVKITYEKGVGSEFKQFLEQLPLGQMIAIKAYSVKYGLYIKALGFIADSSPSLIYDQDLVRKVKWVWKGNQHFGRFKDKMCMRQGAMYVEMNKPLIEKIFDLVR
jgi:hypothetical protein